MSRAAFQRAKPQPAESTHHSFWARFAEKGGPGGVVSERGVERVCEHNPNLELEGTLEVRPSLLWGSGLAKETNGVCCTRQEALRHNPDPE